MRHFNFLHSSVFAGAFLLIGVLAVWRVAESLRLPVSAAVINGEAARQFESHYDEVFPAKTFGVNLWAALEYVLFREGRGGVEIGESGWLYSAEEFRAYADGEAQLLRHLALIAWVRDQLAAREASLLVALVPAKARVYPEYLRTRPSAVHDRLYALTRESLLGLRVTTPDLLTPMLACKQQDAVFLRTDTHWTPLGARCAAQTVGRGARDVGAAVAHPAVYRTRIAAPQAHRGDLFRFLPLDPYFAFLLPPAESFAPERTAPAAGPAEGDLLGDAAAPEVALVGTSYSRDTRWNFAGALQESLGEEIVNVASEGQGPFVPMLEYLRSAEIREAPPRLVIWEIPERYLPMGEDLSGFALPPFGQTEVEPQGVKPGESP